MDELSFKNNNPGAVKHGNFINYYQFHPPEERIKLLPLKFPGKFDKEIVALDLGCNTGDLTVVLQNYLQKNKPTKLIGIDIDPSLIERAQEKWVNNKDIAFKCLNFTKNNDRESCIGTQNFDVVFMFSLTMWIHLNQGDEGLLEFLRAVAKIGRFLVIEPQPWKCYRNALKRVKSLDSFPLFKSLKIRQNVELEIEGFLEGTCGFKKIWESKRSGWERKICIFERALS